MEAQAHEDRIGQTKPFRDDVFDPDPLHTDRGEPDRGQENADLDRLPLVPMAVQKGSLADQE